MESNKIVCTIFLTWTVNQTYFSFFPGYTVWSKCYSYKPNDHFENYTETTYVQKLIFAQIKYLNNYTWPRAHTEIVFSFEWSA